MKLCLLPLLLFPLFAHAEGERVAYACDNGGNLSISFSMGDENRAQATVHFADGDIVLPTVPSTAGARYRAAPVDLRIQGEEAIFEDGKGNIRRCSQQRATAASSFVEIGGTVSYKTRIALPANAELVIRVLDSRRGLTLAEQRYALSGAQVPIPFKATIDRDLVGKRARLAVAARIEQRGRSLFAGQAPQQLADDGMLPPVDILLRPVAQTAKR